MDPTLDKSTLAGRLASFNGSVQVIKRRASSTKKKQMLTVSWPHQTPTPEQLARAGFFYLPSASSTDSVTCFLCDKALDGWEPEDNPFLEHLAHVPDCGWAINTCIEMRSQEPDRAEEDPRSTRMLNARRATFRDQWPHEVKKGWKCKVNKMVEAGWSYDPLPEADDCVKCFYCGVCLDGWEPKDDPWDEHHRRSPDCHFFTLIEDAVKSTKLTRSCRSRTSRLSKASRLSTQSEMDNLLQFDSTNLHEDNISQVDDSVLTTASRNSLMDKAVIKQVKRPNTSNVGRKTTKKVSNVRDKEEPVEIQSNLVDSNAGGGLMDEDHSSPEGAKRKRTTKRTASRALTQSVTSTALDSAMDETDLISQPVKPIRTRATRKKQPEMYANLDQIEAERRTNNAANLSLEETIPPTTNQWKKQFEEEGTNLDSSVIVLDAQTLPSSAAAPIRGKKRTSDGTVKNDGLFTSRPKSNRPPKAMDYDDGSEALSTTKQITNLQKPLPKLPEQHYTFIANDTSSEMLETVEQKQRGIQNEVAVPTGETHEIFYPAIEADEAYTAQAVSLAAHHQGVETVSSQQSSDAENRPPSLRLSVVATTVEQKSKSPGKVMEYLATPEASPSRANRSQGPALKSSASWSHVDLETILLASPSTGRKGDAASATAMETTLQRLSETEKEMSVQEWILWNARQAEDGLKGECERLINVFEREGVRALCALEGIECA